MTKKTSKNAPAAAAVLSTPSAETLALVKAGIPYDLATSPAAPALVEALADSRVNPNLSKDLADKLTEKWSAPAVAALPTRIQLVRPHSFIDTDGAHRMWAQGQVVTDAADIELLISRVATIEVLE